MKGIQIGMMFGHLFLALISLKKPKVTKFFIYYECLWSLVNLTLPNGCPESQTIRLHLTTAIYVMFLSFSFISVLIPILALRIYNDILVSSLIYGEEVTKDVIKSSVLIYNEAYYQDLAQYTTK